MAASGLKEGDEVQVKLIEIDKKSGKYRLSMRALLPKPEGWVERPPREPRRPREDGGNGPRGERRERRDGGNNGPRRPREDRR
jgi:polyribonucleotide nucleotidyltransferase